MDVKDIPNLLQAASVTIAAWSAIYGISAWRRQLIGKKRAEVAETVLTGFYEARDIMEAVRSPAAFGGEGATRPRQEGETERQARHLDGLYVPIERIDRHREFFMALNASRYQFIAYFGREAAAPFETVLQARNRVLIATRMLLMTSQRDGPMRQENIERRQKWEDEIWDTGAGDAIKRDLDEAVAKIEDLCRPVLTEASGILGRLRQNAAAKWQSFRRR